MKTLTTQEFKNKLESKETFIVDMFDNLFYFYSSLTCECVVGEENFKGWSLKLERLRAASHF